MDIKEFFKKFWFICTVAVLFLGFTIAYGIQTYKDRPYSVKELTHDGLAVVAKIGDDSYIYNEDLYGDLYKNYGLSTAFRTFYRDVVRNAVKTTDDMSSYAANFVTYVQANNYSSQYDTQLKQAGYSGIDDLANYVIDALKQEEITGNYLIEHYDEIVAPYVLQDTPRKISHILVLVNDVTAEKDEEGNTTYTPNPTEEEQAKLDAVLAALKEGKDFKEVAKEYSDDSSASIGGLIGIIGKSNASNYYETFSKASLELEYGQVSDVVNSQAGYHIILAEEPTKEELCKDTSFIQGLTANDSTPILKAVMEQADLLGYEIVSEDLKAEIENTLNPTTTKEAE